MRERQTEARSAGGQRAAAPRRRPVAVDPRAPLTAASIVSVQRSAGNAAAAALVQRQQEETAAGDQVRSALRSPGTPLDASFRTRAETFFGADLSHVRVHTDAAAGESARSVQSHAYTSGSHVVFAPSMYDASSAAGQRRLTHELTHVVQQQRGPVAGTVGADGLKISDPADRFEREADRVAGAFAAGQPQVQRLAAGTSGGEHTVPIQRQNGHGGGGGGGGGGAPPPPGGGGGGGGGGGPPPPPGGEGGPPPPPGGAPVVHAPAPGAGGGAAASSYATLDPVRRAAVRKRAGQRYQQEAHRFELELGRFIATRAASLQGAKAMTARVLAAARVVAKRAADDARANGTSENEATAAAFAALWGPANKGITGAVPHTVKSIKRTVAAGNLREQMALVYEIIRSGGLAKVLVQAANEYAAAKGRASVSDEATSKAQWQPAKLSAKKLKTMKAAVDQAGLQADDPTLSHTVFARSDLVSKQDRTIASGKQWRERVGDVGITPESIEQGGDIPLSKRELKAAFPTEYVRIKGRTAGWKQLDQQERADALTPELGTKRLAWAPGHLSYTLGTGIKKEAERLGVHLLGGLSGSSDMYFKAAGYLGLKSNLMAKVRLAALGTMLPAQDHSFHEIMVVGNEYGLPYQPGLQAYLTIPPLQPNQILTGTNRTVDGHGNTEPIPGYWRTKAGLDELTDVLFPGGPAGRAAPGRRDVRALGGRGRRFSAYRSIVGKVDSYAKLKAKAVAATGNKKAAAVQRQQGALTKLGEQCEKWLAGHKQGRDEQCEAVLAVAALVRSEQAAVSAGGAGKRMLTAAERTRLLASDFRAPYEDIEGGFANLTTAKMAFRKNVKNVKAARGDTGDQEIENIRTALTQSDDLKMITKFGDARHLVAALDEPVKDVLSVAARGRSSDPVMSELAAIWQYTTETGGGGKFFDIVNRALNGNGELTAEEYRLVRLGISGLRKLQQVKPYTKDVWRGERAHKGRQPYQVGQVFTYPKFVSTSKRAKQAYFNKNGYPVAIRMTNVKSGVDISVLSQYMVDEGEVLFPPGARFRVTRAKTTKGTAGQWKDLYQTKFEEV